jgi:hypothetical protein
MKTSYQIKKIMNMNGKTFHVILLNNHNEVFETDYIEEATKLCELLNTNSDSGWRYEIISINYK